MRLKKISIIFLLLISSAVFGGGFAIYNLKRQAQSDSFSLQNGCWRVNPKMDLKNPYQRALIALVGLFALRESEVLYFVAREDSDGNPLSSEHTYVLDGAAPDARYWSYTLYGADYFFVKNEEEKYGFNLETVSYLDEHPDNIEFPKNSKKNHQITISKRKQGENWLPSGNESQFYINLRMYNPSPAVYENLAKVVLPTIKRID